MGSKNSKTLSRKGLIKLINKANASKYLCEEHEKIMKMKVQSTFNASVAAKNLTKGRYFDHSRLILQDEAGNSEHYINASYITGFKHPKEYIASPAPLETTSSDFWRMVWEHKSRLIVMLCKFIENGRSQCYRYWSSVEGTTVQFGQLRIKTVKVHSTPFNFQITSLAVTHEAGGFLRVTHFLFENWEEHDISPSESDFLDLVLMVRLYNRIINLPEFDDGYSLYYRSPIIVHCNNGLGRAMTFCAVDISLSRFLETGKVNLFSTVSNLREERYNCLFDVNQYIFCYTVVFHYVNYNSKSQ